VLEHLLSADVAVCQAIPVDGHDNREALLAERGRHSSTAGLLFGSVAKKGGPPPPTPSEPRRYPDARPARARLVTGVGGGGEPKQLFNKPPTPRPTDRVPARHKRRRRRRAALIPHAAK
jgi:hypothetical protein